MRVLIVHTSRYGATREMVDLLASKIHGTVDIVNLRKEKAPKLDPYQVVLIGAPILARRIPVAVRRFIDLRHTGLSSRKVGIFITCIAHWDRAMQYMERNFPNWIRQQAFSKEIFGGKLELNKLSPWHRFIINRFVGIKWNRNHLNPVAVTRMAEAVNKIGV